MRTTVPAAVLAATLLVAGCASPTVTSTPAATSATTLRGTAVPPPDQLVFRVETFGGFVPATASSTSRPWLSVYGDGTAFVLVDRGVTAPGTPVELERASVPRAAVTKLLAEAGASGLFDGRKTDFGDPGVTDVPSVQVSFRPSSGPARRVSVYALYYERDDNLGGRQRDARQALRNLIRGVDDAVERDPTSSPWTPDRIDVTELAGYPSTGTPRPWPGPALGGVLKATPRGRCGVVAGEPARRIYATALKQYNLHWTEGAVTRPLAIRALLPGEQGCQTVTGR